MLLYAERNKWSRDDEDHPQNAKSLQDLSGEDAWGTHGFEFGAQKVFLLEGIRTFSLLNFSLYVRGKKPLSFVS